MQNQPHPHRPAIPQLDTIRVMAMLAIFLHHLWKTVIVAPRGLAQQLLDPVFSSASDGVIIFNVISGFLLAMPHLGPERRPFEGYRVFLKKRFLRIVPPYYLALLVFTAANMLHFSYPLAPAATMLLEHLLFVNALDYSNMLSNFSHFWFLSQLAQFYLLFPLFLRFFLRFGATRAAFSLIGLCWGGWVVLAWCFPAAPNSFPGFYENLMHFNLPGHLPEFAIGMWLASFWTPSAGRGDHRGRLIWPFSLFLCALMVYFTAGTIFRPAVSLPFVHIYHVALSLMLILLMLTWGPVARVGGRPILKKFSERSYSTYIVHHPIFSYVGVMPSTVAHTIGNFTFLAVLLLPLCYFAATLLDLASALLLRKIPTTAQPATLGPKAEKSGIGERQE